MRTGGSGVSLLQFWKFQGNSRPTVPGQYVHTGHILTNLVTIYNIHKRSEP